MRVGAMCAATVVAVCAFGSVVRADPKIVTSPPCMGTSGCLRFSPTNPPNVIAEFVFNAPKGGGTAQVSVDGVMQCVNLNGSTGANFGVVDLLAQIVRDNSAPNPSGLGGQHFAMRIPPAGGTEYSIPINLATRRVVKLDAGKQKFRYKMAIQRMDEATYCDVFNVYMSVVFVP